MSLKSFICAFLFCLLAFYFSVSETNFRSLLRKIIHFELNTTSDIQAGYFNEILRMFYSSTKTKSDTFTTIFYLERKITLK